MGVDLILLPIDHESDGWGFSHTVLNLDRSSDLWERIRALPDEGTPVPESFTTYLSHDESDLAGALSPEEPHYGDTQQDGYGESLCCAVADALWGLRRHPGVMQSARNRAAWAYLGELPPQTRVALYWH